MNKINHFLENILNKKASLLPIILSFLGFLALRVFWEHFFAKSSLVSPFEIILEYIHDVYFFASAFILLWLTTIFFSKEKIHKLSYLFTFGFFLIITPPIIDTLKTRGEVFWSFYLLGSPNFLWNNFITFFGNLPSGIVYFGTKITFFITIILLGSFVFLKTKNYWRTLGSILSSYLVLFLLGSFPSLIFYAYNLWEKSKTFSKIQNFDVALFFGIPQSIFGVAPQALKYTFVYNLNFIFFPILVLLLFIFFFLTSKEKILAVLKNVRYPQIIYHSGLLFIGFGLGYLNYPENFKLHIFSFFAFFVLLICVWLSWISSVIFNDIYDLKIDNISNKQRPLPQKIFAPKEYAHLGWTCLILAVIGSLSLGFIFAFLFLAYQFIAWLYSGQTFRLKKFPLIATFFSSLASLLILFVGYILMSNEQTIHTLSWRIILLLAVSYTISLPIKDFKDIKGDKADNIWTLPVIFKEKKARLIVAINIFISYILSVFLLNELDLFWWAMLAGVASFLIINNLKISSQAIVWRILGVLTAYTLILAKVAFL